MAREKEGFFCDEDTKEQLHNAHTNKLHRPVRKYPWKPLGRKRAFL